MADISRRPQTQGEPQRHNISCTARGSRALAMINKYFCTQFDIASDAGVIKVLDDKGRWL